MDQKKTPVNKIGIGESCESDEKEAKPPASGDKEAKHPVNKIEIIVDEIESDE